ncbi:hypothetical protein Tco_0300299 [Tanacetum coccineum]
MAFGGNTCDLGSFREETDEITDLHQILEDMLLTERGDGVAGIKRRRRDPSSDDNQDLVTASGRALPRELLNFLLKSYDDCITWLPYLRDFWGIQDYKNYRVE